VWQLDEINGKFDVKHLQSELVLDSQITGVHFGPNPNELYLSIYDSNEIQMWERN